MVTGALAIVQARMSSTRLPGKSLADVGGEPVLGLLLSRLARARELGGIVVATSRDAVDDPLAEFAATAGAQVHRGPRDDVLGRVRAAAAGHPGPIVRITGDCPLVDPVVVDAVIRTFVAARTADYAGNVAPRTFPRGLDVEVLSPELLERLDADATDPADREHVTTLVRRDHGRFRSVNLEHPVDLGDLRWTVDHPGDLEFVRAVVDRLGSRRHVAGMEEILAAVRQPPRLSQPPGPRG